MALREERLDDRIDMLLLRNNDQRRYHPEHSIDALDVRQDVAVERPDPRTIHGDEGVEALAGVDAEGVAVECGAAERVAVPSDDPHRESVAVERVHHDSLVHESNEDLLADRGP